MSQVRRVVAPLVRARAGRFAAALSASVLVTVAQLAHPFPLKIVIDEVLGGEATPILDRGAVLVLAAAAGLAIGIAVTEAAAGYVSEVWLRRVGEDVAHELRVAVYSHLQRLSVGYHECHQTGDLVTRLTGDVKAAGELCSESSGRIVESVLLLVGMAVVTVSIDPVLAAVVFLLVPPLAVLAARFRRRLKSASRQQRRQDGVIAAVSTEAFEGVHTVRALAAEPYEAHRLEGTSAQRRRSGMEAATIEGRFGGTIDVLAAVGSATVLAVGVLRVVAGALTVGDLVIMHSYARKLYRPLRDLARQSGRVSRAMARVERVGAVLAADDVLDDPPDGHREGRAAGKLELRDVSFAYDADRGAALRHVNLHVPAGTVVALVGPSGAGKSTFAALVGRFHEPDTGAIELDGRDLRGCSLTWLRRQLGYVLQDTVLFTGTIADNIAYGLEVDRAQVEEAARTADAHWFIVALPDGYDTSIGPSGVALSGGQRRRLSIARAVLRDPAVLILDEPTAGLDTDTAEEVLAGLGPLMRGRTTLIMTHDLRLARRADRVVVMERGHVVETGTPTALLSDRGHFRRIATDQGIAQQPQLPAPHDAALAQLPVLLDTDAVGELLERSHGRDLQLESVTTRYLRYKPETNLVVHYQATTRSGPADVVVMVAADRDLAKRAARPLANELSEHARARTPVDLPIRHDEHLDALVQWLPVDLWLPSLARLTSAPVPGLSGGGEHEPRLLAYKPRRRAVVAIDGHVVKMYAERAAFVAAARALLAAHHLPVITPPAAGIDGQRHLTVQPTVEGGAVRPLDAAYDAGALLGRMHDGRPPSFLRTVDAAAALDAAAASARLAGRLHPAVADRCTDLLARLEQARPAGEPVVLSHGDFHARQLLRTDDRLVLLDLDEMCLAPPALDLATYAAHCADSAPIDATVAPLLDELVEGYGHRPAHLRWHLAVAILRRVPFPFRKPPRSDWPDRIEEMVSNAEAALDHRC